MNKNQSLFFYGLWARLVQFFGIVIMFIALISMNGYILIIGLIAGVIIVFWGKSLRFDYQRQSGNILHRGDW
jgi:hypothetical protein